MGKLGSLLLFVFLIGCSIEEASSVKKNQVESTGEKNVLDFAKGFSIENFEDYTLVKVFENGTLIASYACSENEPNTIPEGSIYLKTPIASIACLSTTYLPYLEKLKSLSKVIGVANPKFVRNEAILQLIEEGKVKSISGASELDVEKIVVLNPEVLMVYPFNSPDYDLVKEYGVDVVYNTEYLETHPLGQTEWLKFYGVLFNKEEDADLAYDEIKKAYLEAKTLITENDLKPKVLAGSIFNNQWTAPGGKSIGATLINDAGGDFLWKEDHSKGSLAKDIETVILESQDANILSIASFYDGGFSIKELLKEDDRYGMLKPVKDKYVLHCNTAQSNYFEDAYLEPHLILKDLIHLFHPSKLPNHKFKYFYRLL